MIGVCLFVFFFLESLVRLVPPSEQLMWNLALVHTMHMPIQRLHNPPMTSVIHISAPNDVNLSRK